MNQKKSVINCICARHKQRTTTTWTKKSSRSQPRTINIVIAETTKPMRGNPQIPPYILATIPGCSPRGGGGGRRVSLSIEKIAEIITINLSDQRMDFLVVLFFSSATVPRSQSEGFFASTPFIGNPFNLLQTSKK